MYPALYRLPLPEISFGGDPASPAGILMEIVNRRAVKVASLYNQNVLSEFWHRDMSQTAYAGESTYTDVLQLHLTVRLDRCRLCNGNSLGEPVPPRCATATTVSRKIYMCRTEEEVCFQHVSLGLVPIGVRNTPRFRIRAAPPFGQKACPAISQAVKIGPTNIHTQEADVKR